MTEQKEIILESVKYIKQKSPFKKSPSIALITYKDASFLREFKVIKSLKYPDIPPNVLTGSKVNEGELLFATLKGSKHNLLIMNGRYNFYEGYTMRQVAHPIYTLRELGVKTVVLIDEVGYLNPRFTDGGIALIYDHINLMGDNPLIGENDETLGTRFPDMSNAYDYLLYDKVEKIFLNRKIKFYPSVYLGITGPETETEAECRFYREIGSDVLGYSLVPENLAVVHSQMKCAAFGMMSRELVADRLSEIDVEEQAKNRIKAEKTFTPLLKDILSIL
jgi:purine-nucleoside phosphorylase